VKAGAEVSNRIEFGVGKAIWFEKLSSFHQYYQCILSILSDFRLQFVGIGRRNPQKIAAAPRESRLRRKSDLILSSTNTDKKPNNGRKCPLLK